MTQIPPDFKPLDPGRMHADDPIEIAYWAKELGCIPAVLSALVARHGEHVTVVRDALARESAATPDGKPAQASSGTPGRSPRGGR